MLDTDIGSDIDDAVCLAYLLANPECDLLGITTVSGQAIARARLASVLCEVSGKDIPIYPGVETPLLIPQLQPAAPQAAALPRWPHKETFPMGESFQFLQSTIRAHPGEVVLLTIGPLTNIAILFALDPEIPGFLKGLVSMAGVFTNRLPGVGPLEWNAMLDPHATAIVYNRQPAYHRSIGLDVTCQVQMPASEIRQLFLHPLLRPVLDFAEVWFEQASTIIFHDPLAATTIFNDQICQFKRGNVEIELASPRLAGLTYWSPQPDKGRHEVALQVRPELFVDHYFSFFKG
ncbi:MAG: nucleoside hydrolase [Anaerolineae bacterium]|nr:nucleoside hydrolase [Anaerolineae bacterium]